MRPTHCPTRIGRHRELTTFLTRKSCGSRASVQRSVRCLAYAATVFSSALALVATTAPDAIAQSPNREGFFIGLGVGAGSLGGDEGSTRESAATAHLKLGTALNEKVLLGAEFSGWLKEELGVNLSVTFATASAYLYPNPENGFFVKGGLGIAEVDVGLGGFGSLGQRGGAATVGAGYDIGFGGRFGLTPYIDYHYGSFDDGTANVLQAGIGFNWY